VPRRPTPRGPLSATVLSALQQPPGSLGPTPPVARVDALANDDLQLALHRCYELHYRGLGANADWECDPALLGFRAELEGALVNRLHDRIGPLGDERHGDVRGVGGALVELVAGPAGPSLSSFLVESGTLGQFCESCVHRSAYQLKEADPPHLRHPENGRRGQGGHGRDPTRRVVLTMENHSFDNYFGAHLRGSLSRPRTCDPDPVWIQNWTICGPR
jgi:hypothetical protein